MGSDIRNAGLTGLFVIILASGIAVLEIVIAKGLWELKNWARILVIVLQSLSIVTGLISLCLYFSDSSSGSGIRLAGRIIGIIINAYIVYWFASNDEYFR
jgi:hypothetical protein